MASENATANANNSVKSFFMLGLDLLGDHFLLWRGQGMGHIVARPRRIAK
jgi:hypothetical protein